MFLLKSLNGLSRRGKSKIERASIVCLFARAVLNKLRFNSFANLIQLFENFQLYLRSPTGEDHLQKFLDPMLKFTAQDHLKRGLEQN